MIWRGIRRRAQRIIAEHPDSIVARLTHEGPVTDGVIWQALDQGDAHVMALVEQVATDLSQALREEEQAAWQRIVRVLSHEINNSLTPIKSIAHSLRRIVDRAEGFQRSEEVQQGLSLIEERSGALGRFLRSYAQLARLPKPNPKQVDVPALVARIVELEKRLPVSVRPSPPVKINEIGFGADGAEWIELYNAGVRPAQIEDWRAVLRPVVPT